MLQQQVAVQVVDFDQSRCVLETTLPLVPGVIGVLRLTIDGNEHVDDIRVLECERLSGTSSRLQVQLEWASPPCDRSIRSLLDRGTLERVRSAGATAVVPLSE